MRCECRLNNVQVSDRKNARFHVPIRRCMFPGLPDCQMNPASSAPRTVHTAPLSFDADPEIGAIARQIPKTTETSLGK